MNPGIHNKYSLATIGRKLKKLILVIETVLPLKILTFICIYMDGFPRCCWW